MDQIALSDPPASDDALMAKVWRRVLWFGFALLLFAQVDKHDIAFAGLTMRRDLGLSAAAFGVCVSIFYVGYIVCEIPSNLVMARVGARAWLARISITLGLASAATMLAVGQDSLLGIRFVLGMAESGMIPGLLLYFTYWFPPAYRARANGWFLVAMPVAGMLAALLSGGILELNGTLGLAGWRWLFLLLGIPPVLLGILAWRFLAERPDRASWLSVGETRQLIHLLAADGPVASGDTVARGAGWAATLFSRDSLCLAVANLGVFVTLSVLTTWTPQIVRALASGQHFALFGAIAALPALAAALFMPLWSRRSDLRSERRWHVVLPTLLSAAGLLLTASRGEPWLQLAGLVLCSMGAYGVFWSLVTVVLPPRHRPAGIAMIHAFGSAGAILSPMVIGVLRDATGNFSAGLLFAMSLLLVSAVALLAVRDGNTSQVRHGP